MHQGQPGTFGYICVYIVVFMADLTVCEARKEGEGGREGETEGGRERGGGGRMGRMNNFQCLNM